MQLPDPTKNTSTKASASSRAKKKLDEQKAKGAQRLANLRKKIAAGKQDMAHTAHAGGHVATTMAVGNALAYTEGRYGHEKTELGGMDMRTGVGATLIVGGLVASAVWPEHADAAHYVTAAGLGSAMAGTMSRSLRAGQKARAEAEAKGGQGGSTATPSSNDAAAKLVEEVKSTKNTAAGARPKREVRPSRHHPGIPPHLAKFLQARSAAAAA